VQLARKERLVELLALPERLARRGLVAEILVQLVLLD
jgi:hypothetical protein